MTFRSCKSLLILLIGTFLVNPVFADEFSRAKQLIKQNKSRQAYHLLVNDEGYHMGEPAYDLLLAQAALAAGLYHEAIFAYERVLIHTPNNLKARIEMAIAYYKINELENAQRHLNIILAAKPGAKLRETLDQYVALINDKIASRKNEFSGQHSFRQGWDSNINSATNESEIKLTIGNYRPTEGIDKETSDTYSELINRFNIQHHFNVNSSLYSNLGYSIRNNNSYEFDTEVIDVNIGYEHKTAIGKISIPLAYQALAMDGKQLRDVSSLEVTLNRSDKKSFANYSIQYGEIRYADQDALNVNHLVLSYFYSTNHTTMINQQIALFYGDETELNSLYRFNARKYKGVQLRFPIRLSIYQSLTPRLVYQSADHKAQHPFFFKKRQDTHQAVSLDWNWRLGKSWQLIGQLSHSRNQSTVDLYNYTRNTLYGGITFIY